MDGVKRTIELVLTAKDQASGTVARAGRRISDSLKRELSAVQKQLDGVAFGPQTKQEAAVQASLQRRKREIEQAIKAEQDAIERARIDAEASRRVREARQSVFGRTDAALGRDDPEWRAWRQRQAAMLRQSRQRDMRPGMVSDIGVKQQLKQLREIGEVLQGGGAVAGFTAIGKSLANAATRAKELREQFERGEITAGDMVEQIARGLPLLGGWITAGREIRELIRGSDYSTIIERQIQFVERLDAAVSKLREGAAAAATARERRTRTYLREQTAGSMPPEVKERNAINDELEDRLEASRRAREEARNIVNSGGREATATAGELARLQDKLAKLRAEHGAGWFDYSDDIKATEAAIEQLRAKQARLNQEMSAAKAQLSGGEFDREEAEARAAAAAKLHELEQRVAEKRRRQEEKAAAENERLQREHSNRLVRMEAEAAVTRLENQGRFHDARLRAIWNARQDEEQAIEEQFEQEVARIKAHGVDVDRLIGEAVKRRHQALDAAREREKEARALELQREEEDRRRRERSQTRDMTDSRANLAETALRLSGRDEDAAKLRRQYEHQRELQDIKDRAEEEAKANAKEADQIRKNAEERINARKLEFALNERLREQQEREGKTERFRPSDAALERGENRLLTGAMARGLREMVALEAQDRLRRDQGKDQNVGRAVKEALASQTDPLARALARALGEVLNKQPTLKLKVVGGTR